MSWAGSQVRGSAPTAEPHQLAAPPRHTTPLSVLVSVLVSVLSLEPWGFFEASPLGTHGW